MGKIFALDEKKVSYTWEEALQEFLFYKQAQGISKRTTKDYTNHVRGFFKRFPDGWQSPKLKKDLMTYMSDGIKPATFNLRLIYLRTFFNWCVEEGVLIENPLRKFKQRKTEPRIVELSEDTLQTLLTLPDTATFSGLRDYGLMLVTLDTGVRPSEAFALIEEDFNFKQLTVTIRAEVAKTRETRMLPILPETVNVILRLIRSRHPDWSGTVPVFCTYEGNILHRSSWQGRLQKYSKKLGEKVRPYDLRHAFALQFLRNGGHAFALQRMLGHSDMSMTQRYVHLTGNDLKAVHKGASPLNRLLPKKEKRVRKVNL